MHKQANENRNKQLVIFQVWQLISHSLINLYVPKKKIKQIDK